LAYFGLFKNNFNTALKLESPFENVIHSSLQIKKEKFVICFVHCAVLLSGNNFRKPDSPRSWKATMA